MTTVPSASSLSQRRQKGEQPPPMDQRVWIDPQQRRMKKRFRVSSMAGLVAVVVIGLFLMFYAHWRLVIADTKRTIEDVPSTVRMADAGAGPIPIPVPSQEGLSNRTDRRQNQTAPSAILSPSQKVSINFDVTYLRKHPLPFTHRPQPDLDDVCSERPGNGEEGSSGIKGLRKIKIMDRPLQPTRVLCIIYTHSRRHDVVRAVAETYGQRCDGFLAASNETDQSIGAFNIPHTGEEAYKNMWQKVRSIWKFVYENYVDDFDFFHLGGDNMFVIPENLRYALSEMNRSEPIYTGAAMGDKIHPRRWFCGGGAGYTLNQATVRMMVGEIFGAAHCFPNGHRSDEDRSMGKCLRPRLIKCLHNMDELGEARYHHYDAEFHATWKRGRKSNWNWQELEQHANLVPFKDKLESISSTSVSFHLVGQSLFRDQGVRRYYALLYGHCQNHPSFQEGESTRRP